MHYVALRRLRPYVRPHRKQLAVMMTAALVGLVVGALVPLVAKAVVDGPVAHHRRAGVFALASLALLFGLIESAMACLRRFVLTNASLGLETTLRDVLYAHLQRLPVAFHDQWQSGQLLSRAAAGALRFEAVRFAFPDSDGEVLAGVDLVLAPGERVGLVGRSGSGKTVLTQLVPRLYDPTSGRVTLDGTDLADLTLASLRAQVGMAFEEPVLFSMSVAENLRLGAPAASHDDLAAALALCQAEFVFHLPHGLDTRVGEQGLTLSGGQRQRLALALAVLGRPRVLVLDDALSALDVHTEAAVVAGLERALRGTTALVATHRPTTLALVDRVALLDGGVIAATGTHADLLSTVAAYRTILSDVGPADSGDTGPAGPADPAAVVGAGEKGSP